MRRRARPRRVRGARWDPDRARSDVVRAAGRRAGRCCRFVLRARRTLTRGHPPGRADRRRSRGSSSALRCASSRICCSRWSPGWSGGRFSTASRSGKTMSSSPGLRSGPFAMPISGVWCRPCSASTSAATATCPLPAVDHQQIGCRIFAGDDARAAPRQRFAHRRVVVAAVRRRHVEAPIFGRLHRELVEDDARRDRRLAHRVRDVEALDPLRRRRQMPSASCSAASRSSCVAFCASFWRIASVAFCVAIVSHTRRSPPGLVMISTLRPDCAVSTSASASASFACGAIRCRRHGPLDIVLRQERGDDIRFVVTRLGMPRKERAVADVAAAADHHRR